jgi:hypothetical protein
MENLEHTPNPLRPEDAPSRESLDDVELVKRLMDTPYEAKVAFDAHMRTLVPEFDDLESKIRLAAPDPVRLWALRPAFEALPKYSRVTMWSCSTDGGIHDLARAKAIHAAFADLVLEAVVAR